MSHLAHSCTAATAALIHRIQDAWRAALTPPLEPCLHLAALAAEEGDTYGQALAHTALGGCYLDRLDGGRWLPHLERAAALGEAGGCDSLLARVYRLLGLHWELQGDELQTLRFYLDGIARAKACGDRAGEGAILLHLGAAFQRHNSYGDARSYYRQAAETLSAEGMPPRLLIALCAWQIDMALLTGDLTEARRQATLADGLGCAPPVTEIWRKYYQSSRRSAATGSLALLRGMHAKLELYRIQADTALLRQKKARLETQNLQDKLTGLYNRRWLNHHLSCRGEAQREALGFIVLDVDCCLAFTAPTECELYLSRARALCREHGFYSLLLLLHNLTGLYYRALGVESTAPDYYLEGLSLQCDGLRSEGRTLALQLDTGWCAYCAAVGETAGTALPGRC